MPIECLRLEMVEKSLCLSFKGVNVGGGNYIVPLAFGKFLKKNPLSTALEYNKKVSDSRARLKYYERRRTTELSQAQP